MSLPRTIVRSTYHPPAAWSRSDADGRQRRAREQLAHAQRPRGEEGERGEVDRSVDGQGGGEGAGILGSGADPPGDGDPGDDGRRHEPGPQRQQNEHPARPRAQGAAPREPGHVPDRLERAAERDGHPEARPQRAGEPDDERHRTAGQRLDLVLELRADDRDPGERRVEHVLLERRVVLQHEPERGDEHQQQREQREERVVGDQRREAGRPVVEELAHDRHGHGDGGAPALPAVERAPRPRRRARARQRRELTASGMPDRRVDDDGAGEEVGQAAPACVEQHRQEAREQRDDRQPESDEPHGRAHHPDVPAALGEHAEPHQPHPRRLPGRAPEQHEVGRRRRAPTRTAATTCSMVVSSCASPTSEATSAKTAPALNTITCASATSSASATARVATPA